MVLIIDKSFPELEGEGGVIWTKVLIFGYDHRFISPKDFMSSFKWTSPTSFTFKNFSKTYILDGIDKEKPVLKEIDKK